MPSLFYTIENGRGSARLLLNIEGHFIINHSGEAHRVSLKNDTLTIYDCYFPFPEGVKLETITMVKRQ